MLSKCANPECSEILRYLHQGKIFCLAPTPEVQSVTGMLNPAFEERFWLCERCSKEMTVVWGGTRVRLVRLPSKVAALPPAASKNNKMRKKSRRARAASPDHEDR
jgi:hypothetical protein